MIEIKNLSFSYITREGLFRRTKVDVLRNINLKIKKNDFVSIIGPSGCGKSTLFRLIAGLEKPITGEIRINGKELEQAEYDIGLAAQNPILLPWRTNLNNILLVPEVADNGGRKHRLKEYEKTAKELLKTVGLEGFFDRRPYELSGGMQQRVNLCRALILMPRLLLLDEPFGALDEFTREELWLVLERLWLKYSPTIVLVTHHIDEAIFLSNKVYILSSRPATVIHEEPINFSRPRKPALRYTPVFVKKAGKIKELIVKERPCAKEGAANVKSLH